MYQVLLFKSRRHLWTENKGLKTLKIHKTEAPWLQTLLGNHEWRIKERKWECMRKNANSWENAWEPDCMREDMVCGRKRLSFTYAGFKVSFRRSPLEKKIASLFRQEIYPLKIFHRC